MGASVYFSASPPRTVSQGGTPVKKIIGYLRDERGIETLEWIAVAALIVALAIAVYPGTLQTAINDVITSISGKLALI
jgi:Flp pilus assembly pilin Flp